MKSLLTISMVLGTILVLESSANAFIFGSGNSSCCRTNCCRPTCCSPCCRSSGFLGYHGGGVWGW